MPPTARSVAGRSAKGAPERGAGWYRAFLWQSGACRVMRRTATRRLAKANLCVSSAYALARNKWREKRISRYGVWSRNRWILPIWWAVSETDPSHAASTDSDHGRIICGQMRFTSLQLGILLDVDDDPVPQRLLLGCLHCLLDVIDDKVEVRAFPRGDFPSNTQGKDQLRNVRLVHGKCPHQPLED